MHFKNCNTPESIKTEYHRLAKMHHPDIGGDTETMRKINTEYHEALKRCDGYIAKGEDDQDHTYHYNQKIEQEIIDKISALLSLKMIDVDVWLIGTWVWIRGKSKPYKEELKKLGCRWHSKRTCWYWRRGSSRRYGYSKGSFSSLAEKYGASHFRSKKEEKRALP